MERTVLKQIIEALLFSSDAPLTSNKMQDIFEGVTSKEINESIEELKQEYQTHNRAFEINELGNGYQLLTKTDFHPWIIKLNATKQENKLSSAAMETLAIIAYKQPILKAEVESIRGVDSGAIIRGLMEKGIVRISGRAETLGHPILYGTTPRFLELLGLANIKDLPKPEEVK
jgi:segregation and condensation protein B